MAITDPSQIGGIRPEDVKQTPEQIAQVNAFLAQQKAEEEALGKETEVELMESELMGVWKLLQELQYKYGNRKGSFENLSSLRAEAEERFAELGFQVVVDWVLPGLMQLNGNNSPEPPTITIVGRLDSEFNNEQNRYETGMGVADDYYDAKRKALRMGNKKLILPGQ
jgi:hypothetical protein